MRLKVFALIFDITTIIDVYSCSHLAALLVLVTDPLYEMVISDGQTAN